jgi:hypothetical protein
MISFKLPTVCLMYRELEEFSEKAYSAYIAIVRTWALWLQGCQIEIFKPEISILVNSGGSCLQWKTLAYYMAIWYNVHRYIRPFGLGISWPFGTIFRHLVQYFRPFWYVVPI